MVNNSFLYFKLIREYLGNCVLFGVLCFFEDNEKYLKDGKRGVKNERENRRGKVSLVMED